MKSKKKLKTLLSCKDIGCGLFLGLALYLIIRFGLGA